MEGPTQVSAAELLALVTLPLLVVIVQLQRLIPLFKAQVTTTNETRADVADIRAHLRVPPRAIAAKASDAS